MSRIRLDLIKRYFKISNPTTDLDSKKSAWYIKIRLSFSNFAVKDQNHIQSNRYKSFDKQLNFFND